MRILLVAAALLAGCHRAPPPPPPPPPPPLELPVLPPPDVTVRFDSTPPQVRRTTSDTALSAAEREAIVREAQTRRAAWRARGIADYRIRIAVGCFCPWPQRPAILEVRRGVAVGLRDTTGRGFGALREPWSIYTIEGLFDAVEQGARRDDIFEVTYDPRWGYPTYIRGDAKLGLPDDWFWVRATELTPRP